MSELQPGREGEREREREWAIEREREGDWIALHSLGLELAKHKNYNRRVSKTAHRSNFISIKNYIIFIIWITFFYYNTYLTYKAFFKTKLSIKMSWFNMETYIIYKANLPPNVYETLTSSTCTLPRSKRARSYTYIHPFYFTYILKIKICTYVRTHV